MAKKKEEISTVEDEVKTKEVVKDTSDIIEEPIMQVATGFTIREIVTKANNLMIKKEDIVTLVKENAQYLLVYYS